MADSGQENTLPGSEQKAGQRETLRIPALPPRPPRPPTSKLAPRPNVVRPAANTLPLPSGKGFIPVPANAPGWSTAVTKPLSMGDPAEEPVSSRPPSQALNPPIAPARPVASALPPAPARAATRPASPPLSGASPTSKTAPIRTPDGYGEPHATNPANVATQKSETGNVPKESQETTTEIAPTIPRVIVAAPQAKVFLEAADRALPADLATVDFNSQAPARLETQALPMVTSQRANPRLDISVPLAEPAEQDSAGVPPQPALDVSPAPVSTEEPQAELTGLSAPPAPLPVSRAVPEAAPEALSIPPRTPDAFTPNQSFAQTLPIARPVRSLPTAPAAGLPPRPNSATRAFATDRLPNVPPDVNGAKGVPPIAPPLAPSDPHLSTLSRPVMPLNVVATGPFPSPSSIISSAPSAAASPVAPAAPLPPPKIALATPPPAAKVPVPPMADASEDRTQVLPLPTRGLSEAAGPRPPIAPPMPESRAIELDPLPTPGSPLPLAPAAEAKASPTPPVAPARPLAVVPGKVVAPPRRTQTGPINSPVSRPGAITARLDSPPPVPTPIGSDESTGATIAKGSSPATPSAISSGSAKPAPLVAVPVPKPIAAARPAIPALPQPIAPSATPSKPALPVAPVSALAKPVMPVAPAAGPAATAKMNMPPPPPGVASARPVATVKPLAGTPTPSAPQSVSEAPASNSAPPASPARSTPPKETARITIKPNRPGGNARLAGAVKPLVSSPVVAQPATSPGRTPAADPATASKSKPTFAPTAASSGSKSPGPASPVVPVETFEYSKSTRLSTIAAGVLALLTWSVAGFLGYVAFLS